MHSIIQTAVRQALSEDVQGGDITSSLLDNGLIFNAKILAREAGVLCGVPWVNETYRQLNPSIQCTFTLGEGTRFEKNQTVAHLKGSARDLLTGERMALNWLQTLSGVATNTALYVSALAGSRTTLLDTRKTIPTLRYAQKYAVRCGGGHNHRMGLFDAFLIKENHIKAYGSIGSVIAAARAFDSTKTLEIEVQDLDMLQEAIRAKPDIILLDNFNVETMREAVQLTKGQVKLEVSGNITLIQIPRIVQLSIDYISVGAITKDVRAIDFSMLIQ